MGARSFLVINSPDIALIPETQLIAIATNNPSLPNRANKLTKLYNENLHDVVKKFKNKDNIYIREFDLFNFFSEIIKNSITYGFTNNSDACFSPTTGTFHPDCNFGLNADQFIFFDEIHPTTRVHALFGDAFYEALKHHYIEYEN